MSVRERLRHRFPIVAAHRGASRVAPENTLAAFERARDLGAAAIELDVQVTRDDVVVVMHDLDLDRTTDGQGAVRERTWPELAALDAGAWFHPSFGGARIPRLEEVLDWAKGRTFLNIELKPADDDGRLEEGVVALVRSHAMTDEALVMSFDHVAVERVARAAPEIITLAITGARLTREIDYLKAMGAGGSNHSPLWWTPRTCAAFHEADLIAHASGISEPERWQRALEAGVDMVDSNEPAIYGGRPA
jgi:glycerophosphoryl diester phosphodiesterase